MRLYTNILLLHSLFTKVWWRHAQASVKSTLHKPISCSLHHNRFLFWFSVVVRLVLNCRSRLYCPQIARLCNRPCRWFHNQLGCCALCVCFRCARCVNDALSFCTIQWFSFSAANCGRLQTVCRRVLIGDSTVWARRWQVNQLIDWLHSEVGAHIKFSITCKISPKYICPLEYAFP